MRRTALTRAFWLLGTLWSVFPAAESRAQSLSCGDINGDSKVDISDPIYLLSFLFSGGRPPVCPTAECLTPDGRPIPVAPESARVDLFEPSFSNSTEISNPLFPISLVSSAIQLGTSDGEALRVEVTLLPETRVIEVNGRPVETLVSQFVAFIGGRIHEVALDHYGQADDGSVWYFGEDVYNFEDGVVADREGTWLAGRDGPAAMIMPADPRVGDVYRPENVCGIVFEEVTVKTVGLNVEGPAGPVEGAILIHELHQDLSTEDKTFAPLYGEFATGSGSNFEAVALSVPPDALPGLPPNDLNQLSAGATEIFGTIEENDWDSVEDELDAIVVAWETYKSRGTPTLLTAQMTDAIESLKEAVELQNGSEAQHASIEVSRAALDFRLRYRPATEIDASRFKLWVHEILVDAKLKDSAGIQGDVATLEWSRARFAHTLSGSLRGQMDALVAELRTAADEEDFVQASESATELIELLTGM